MGDFNNIKNICGFYVSGVHLITMILPHIRKQIQDKVKTETFFEYNLIENTKTVLNNLIINEEDKQKILDVNWKSSKIQKYSNVEKKLKSIIDNEKEVNILISGSRKYINETNKMINKFLEKNINKLNHKYITIINCYEVAEFDDNIREILDNQEYI